MSEFSLKERAEMITSSLVFGGAKTFEELSKLDWLKNTSDYGVYMYLREAERNGWIETTIREGKPNIYHATRKGRKMADERE